MHSNYFTYTIPASGGQSQSQVMSIPIISNNTRQINQPVQQQYQVTTTNVVSNQKYIQNPVQILPQLVTTIKSENPINSHTNNEVTASQTVCSICGQLFKKSSSLLKHMRVHRTKNDTEAKPTTSSSSFICHICKIDYVNAATFEYHIRTQHGTPQAMNCIDCGGIGMMSVATNLPFRCDDCAKSKKSVYLSTDAIEYNGKTRTNSRATKNAKNVIKPDMEQLVEIMRSGDTNGRRRKQHECNWCGRTYKHQSTLAMHKKIHTGEYKYKCEYCDKEFFLAEYYNRHLRVHTKEKPYQCDVCDKSFSQSNTLIQHKRIHTGLN